MNNQNKIIIWSIVGVVIILAAVGIYKWEKAKQADQYATDQAAMNASLPTPASKPTLAQFIRKGGSYQCTVRQSIGGVASTGMVYINGGMVRGDFSADANGSAATGSTIVRDGFAYTWSSSSKSGVKMPVASSGTLSGFVQVSGNTYSWNADQITDYNCSAWTPDPLQFSIPSNIEFRDLELKG